MDAARYKKITDLVNAALELTVDERPAFVDGEAGDDAELRQEVLSLLEEASLAGTPSTDDLLGIPGGMASMLELGPPRNIGPFEIVGELGEGGMGAVYLAEQKAPVERRVALKLIHTSLRSQAAARRFEAERQAMARLSHPHIAQIHDAGTTPEGLPWFAMELVEGGMPITRYCDAERLSIDERIRLFVAVCHAVQHAHQRGILHRDLKPPNILVRKGSTGPIPKLIDFGLAKALDQPLTPGAAELTGQQILGTLAYIAPESLINKRPSGSKQKSSLGWAGSRSGTNGSSDDTVVESAVDVDSGPTFPDVDTRADIYSLGVVLYELLCGFRPFELDDNSVLASVARLTSEVVAPPSRRHRDSSLDVGSAAEVARGLGPGELQRRLAGDLDLVVLKAIDRDRERRYLTAADLAEDLERWRAGRPVRAHPPSALYRWRKFAERHRMGLAVFLGVTLLILSSLGALWQTRRDADRRARLATELNREVERIEWLQRVNDQLPFGSGRGDALAIREAMARIEGRASEDDRGLAAYALGRGELALGHPMTARGHFESALRQGYEEPEVHLGLGWALSDLYERARDRIRRISDPDLRTLEYQRIDRELRAPAVEHLERGRGSAWIEPDLLEATLALHDENLDEVIELGRRTAAGQPWLYEARFVVGRALLRQAIRATRVDKDEEANYSLHSEAIREVELGLEVGRSDVAGHRLLCLLHSNRTNRAARFSRPEFETLFEQAREACERASLADPESAEPAVLRIGIWISKSDVLLWDRGEDPSSVRDRVLEIASPYLEADSEGRVLGSPAERGEILHSIGRSHQSRAIYLYRQGEDPLPTQSRAVEFLERAVELDPENVENLARLSETLSFRANWLQQRGEDPREDLDRAVAYARRATELQTDVFSNQLSLGQSLLLYGHYAHEHGEAVDAIYEQADAAYSHAWDLEPDSLVVPGSLVNVRLGQSWMLRYRGEDQESVLKDALILVEKALAKDSEEPYHRFQDGQVHLGLAWNALQRGEDPSELVARSRQAFELGLEILPRVAGVWVELAELAFIEARWALSRGLPVDGFCDEAERRARRALEIDAARGDAHRMLASAALMRAEGAEPARADRLRSRAGAELDRAIELAPVDWQNRLVWARLVWSTLRDRSSATAGIAAADEALYSQGLEQAREAERINGNDAEGGLLHGAILALDPEQRAEGERRMATARERNPRLVLDWRKP